MDPRVAALLEEVRSPDGDRAEAALEALDSLGAGAVPSLLPLLRDADERVRVAALGTVALHGDRSPAALREVIRGAQAALRNFEEAASAARVHEAVCAIRGPLEALVPDLLRDLGGGEPEGRLAAARDLETLTHYLGPAGADGGALVGALVASLADGVPRVRWWAAGALGNLALEPGDSVPGLARALGDAEGAVRLAAVEALEKFGPEAAPAAPALLPLLGEEDGGLAARALLAAARTGRGSGAVHAAVAARVADPRAAVRAAACAALGELGNAPREAFAAALRDPDEEVRRAAGWALSRIRALHGS
jgi:HEAT repeat protein